MGIICPGDFELFSSSNHYLSAPRGARGVKRTGRTSGTSPRCVLPLIFSLNGIKFKITPKNRHISTIFVEFEGIFAIHSILAEY